MKNENIGFIELPDNTKEEIKDFMFHMKGNLPNRFFRVSGSIDKLTKSINEYSESTKDLSKKTFWLNVIIAFATFIGALGVIPEFYN